MAPDISLGVLSLGKNRLQAFADFSPGPPRPLFIKAMGLTNSPERGGRFYRACNKNLAKPRSEGKVPEEAHGLNNLTRGGAGKNPVKTWSLLDKVNSGAIAELNGAKRSVRTPHRLSRAMRFF
jgi:hypothetical protein